MSSEGARHSEGARTSKGAPGHGRQSTDNKSNEQSHQQSNQCIDHNANQCANSRYDLQTHQYANHISQTRPPSKTTHRTTTQRRQHHRQQPRIRTRAQLATAAARAAPPAMSTGARAQSSIQSPTWRPGTTPGFAAVVMRQKRHRRGMMRLTRKQWPLWMQTLKSC